MTHQFFSIFRIVVNERHSIKKKEDTISRYFGFGIVWGKGSCLTNGKCTKDDGKEDTEDITERLMQKVVGRKVRQECTKSKYNGKQKEDDSLREAIGEAIHRRVHGHSTSTSTVYV